MSGSVSEDDSLRRRGSSHLRLSLIILCGLDVVLVVFVGVSLSLSRLGGFWLFTAIQ